MFQRLVNDTLALHFLGTSQSGLSVPKQEEGAQEK